FLGGDDVYMGEGGGGLKRIHCTSVRRGKSSTQKEEPLNIFKLGRVFWEEDYGKDVVLGKINDKY
ncbi:hypothetical protein QA860_42550, partial [Streptomyces stelliscabiei]|uniref:hypothetical protein n=1 Tax=Streptomyces stelliscabiei TaxID=146820 RepID=UPI002FEF264F